MGQHTDRRALGYGIIFNEFGAPAEHDTLQCCHCGGHFIVSPGSGKRRGFCMNCGAVTCGQEKCHQCIPFMKKLELYEKGKLDVLR